MQRRSDSLKANLCQAQQRDLKTIAPLSHRPIVLTDTIDYRTISFLHYRPNPNIHAPIVNQPNSAQLQGTPYHSPKLHPGPYSSVGMWRGTDRQTDRQTDRPTHRQTWPLYISPRLRPTVSHRNQHVRQIQISYETLPFSFCIGVPTSLC